MKLEQLGLDIADAYFNGDMVIAEGDIVYDVDKLLRDEYGPLIDPSDADAVNELIERLGMDQHGSALVEKGYLVTSSSIIDTQSRANIKSVDNGLTIDVLKRAAKFASSIWSQVEGSDVRISSSNTGPSIRFNQPATSMPCTDPASGMTSVACAYAPSGGKPGTDVWFVKDPTTVSWNVMRCNWTASWADRVAFHEIGHALGLGHPKPGSNHGTHIAGTAMCSIFNNNCVNQPGYQTIMGAATIDSFCNAWPDSPQADDRKSLAAIY